VNGLVLGLGSWGAAVILVEGGDNLIGWFDQYDADKGGSSSTHASTAESNVFWDNLNHTLLTLAYGALSFVVAGSSWAYVYGQYTDPAFLPTA